MALLETRGARASRYELSGWEDLPAGQRALAREGEAFLLMIGGRGPADPGELPWWGFVQPLWRLCSVRPPSWSLRAIPTTRGSWNILCLKSQGRRAGAVGNHCGFLPPGPAHLHTPQGVAEVTEQTLQ